MPNQAFMVRGYADDLKSYYHFSVMAYDHQDAVRMAELWVREGTFPLMDIRCWRTCAGKVWIDSLAQIRERMKTGERV